MNRVRTRLGAALAVVALSASALAVTGGAAHAVTNFPNPKLTFSKLIPSRPWPTGTLTSVNANDVEGMVSVPTNNSIWVADDNRDRIFEIDATTGGLKSQITGAAFQTATQVGTNKLCSDPSLLDSSIPTDTGAFECLSRTDDFESIVYDPGTTPGVNDVLYVTSGGCCPGGLPAGYKDNPTVWKLTRSGSTFTPSQWQALPEGEDPTAAGWRPSGGSGASGFYYGKDNFYRTYDFATNALGTMHSAPSYLVGIDFTDASHVFITTSTPHPNQTGRTTALSDSTVKQYTFDGTSFTAVPGWSFPLKNTGMIDARDLALVGDTFFVSDGYDFRTGTETNGTTTPNDHPIYVYNLVDGTPQPALHFETLNGVGTGVSNDHFANGNVLLPAGGQFHGFYGNISRASLTHSWWNGTRWSAENLDGGGINTTDAVGANVTAIAYGGQIQLLYTDATRHTLRHAWWDGTRWNFETLDGAGGPNGRIGTPVAGSTIAYKQFGTQVHAFYSDDTTHKLRHGWWNGTQWTFENLDTSATLSSTAFISTAQLGTTVHVVTKTSAGALRHGWYSGGWHYETVDGPGGVSGSTGHNVGDFATMVPFGSQLDVAYRDNTSSAVRHAWLVGTDWSFETIDGIGGNASGATSHPVGVSIALMPFGGQLHVVYQDKSTGAQRHAWYSGGWHAEILDGTGSVKAGASNSTNTGLNNAMAVFGGQLHVSYFDHAKGDTFRHSWMS